MMKLAYHNKSHVRYFHHSMYYSFQFAKNEKNDDSAYNYDKIMKRKCDLCFTAFIFIADNLHSAIFDCSLFLHSYLLQQQHIKYFYYKIHKKSKVHFIGEDNLKIVRNLFSGSCKIFNRKSAYETLKFKNI